jgi:hypothetical protein
MFDSVFLSGLDAPLVVVISSTELLLLLLLLPFLSFSCTRERSICNAPALPAFFNRLALLMLKVSSSRKLTALDNKNS